MRTFTKYSSSLILLIVFLGIIISVFSIKALTKSFSRNQAIEEVKKLNETISTFRTLYTSEVIQKLQNSGVEITHDYKSKNNAVPLPATLSMHVGEMLSDSTEGSSIKLYSPYPFPHREKTGGLKDDFQKKAWKILNQDPTEPYYEITQEKGVEFIRYATADIMRPSCIGCHNSHPLTPKNDWELDQVRGVLEVKQPIYSASKNNTDSYVSFWFFIILPFLTIVLVLFIVVRYLKSKTIELSSSNIELKTKTKELDSSMNELSSLSYSLSHDLKTPVSGINSLASFIKADLGENISEEVKNHIELIEHRTELMDNLINSYKRFIKIGQTAPVFSSFYLGEVSLEVSKEFQEFQNLKINHHLNTFQLSSDRNKIAEILKELINNSLNHSSVTDVNVQIKAEEIGNEIYITVEDNGEGFSPEFNTKVLEKFQTLEQKSLKNNSGLGLSIVHKLVLQLNGKMTFNKSDKTFAVTIILPKVD